MYDFEETVLCFLRVTKWIRVLTNTCVWMLTNTNWNKKRPAWIRITNELFDRCIRCGDRMSVVNTLLQDTSTVARRTSESKFDSKVASFYSDWYGVADTDTNTKFWDNVLLRMLSMDSYESKIILVALNPPGHIYNVDFWSIGWLISCNLSPETENFHVSYFAW